MTRGRLAAGCAMALLAAPATAGPAMAPPPGPPSWSDEFDGTTPDPRKWGFETERNRAGWYNGEKQYYAAGPGAQARIGGGRLRIVADRAAFAGAPPADWGGQAYASARLSTAGLAGWTHGFVAVRAKLPCGRGMWPAIWMLPDTGPWPAAGEIDIAEQVGTAPDTVHATLHYADAQRAHRSVTAARTVAGACGGFHTYQLDWRAGRIRMGVDGAAYADFATDAIRSDGRPTFDARFHLILNLAVGGSWAGTAGIDDAALPQALVVDYVRVWSR